MTHDGVVAIGKKHTSQKQRAREQHTNYELRIKGSLHSFPDNYHSNVNNHDKAATRHQDQNRQYTPLRFRKTCQKLTWNPTLFITTGIEITQPLLWQSENHGNFSPRKAINQFLFALNEGISRQGPNPAPDSRRKLLALLISISQAVRIIYNQLISTLWHRQKARQTRTSKEERSDWKNLTFHGFPPIREEASPSSD